MESAKTLNIPSKFYHSSVEMLMQELKEAMSKEQSKVESHLEHFQEIIDKYKNGV